MATKATAVDIGSHSARVLVAQVGKHGVGLLRFAGLPRREGRVSLDDAGIPLKDSTCGLAGRDMTLRYSQVPPTPDWQLRNLMDLEIQDLAQQSGGELSADYNLLPIEDESGSDTVLLALAKDEGIERLQQEVRDAGGEATAFVPNCTALYNAFLKCGPVEADSVVALVNIGHETMDLAIVRGMDLLFARNLTTGTKTLDDAIASNFNVGARKAEALKKDLLDLDPQSRGNYASGQAEKVTMAAAGAAGSIPAAINSSLSFCKAQTKISDLRLDKVLVCGGGARLRGLRSLLREGLRCPVEVFDPFDNVDLSALPPDDAEQLQQMRYEAVVALGLAVGRLDDTLYSIEILPEAVKRKQRFQQRTVWNILAVAMVLLVLFLQFRHDKAEFEAVERDKRSRQIQVSRISNTLDNATRQIEANETGKALVAHLQEKAVPLHAMLRVKRAVARHLPPQLWLLGVDYKSGGRVGNQQGGKQIVIDVAAKDLDGADGNRVLGDFHKMLQADEELVSLGEARLSKLDDLDNAKRARIMIPVEGN